MNEIKIVNLTPHVLNVHDGEGNERHSLPPSGEVARITSKKTLEGDLLGVPLHSFKFGEVEGLPPPQKDTVFAVSGVVFQESGRPDLIAPGDLVRDPDGRPIGCLGFKCRAGGLEEAHDSPRSLSRIEELIKENEELRKKVLDLERETWEWAHNMRG